MKRFSITTLGCKVNQSESETMARQLSKKTCVAVNFGERADYCIINTCTVTAKASMQSRQAVRKAVRKYPDAHIIVTGCYAQTEPDQILKIRGVDEVVGHAQKLSIPHRICFPEDPPPEIPCPFNPKMDGFSNTDGSFLDCHGERTRQYLKIQDGCNTHCTYCIVPQARGKSRSMPIEKALSAITRLKTSNFREVILTGIHLGSYGLDLSPKTSLFDLLKQIRDSDTIERVRLSSIEPLELNTRIIRLVAESAIFCRHFHIPLQSGDNEILRRMHRPYTSEIFKALIEQIIELMPDTAIGVDILVGFPGETDEAFGNTYTLIEKLPITYLHVFPFSPRPGTPASFFPDPVPRKIIKSRTNKMRRLGAEKKVTFLSRHLGRHTNILVEGKRDRRTNNLVGTTDNYIKVFIKGHETLKNKIIPVKLNILNGGQSIFGSIIS